jgi:uncharacterized membrane protein YfbV (UPF0208 family)
MKIFCKRVTFKVISVTKHTNILLVLATCIRSGREYSNILHIREKLVMQLPDENLTKIREYSKNIMLFV